MSDNCFQVVRQFASFRVSGNIEQLAPPPDPLGEVDPEKSQRFMLASGINRHSPDSGTDQGHGPAFGPAKQRRHIPSSGGR
jgi:hypothetical protein